MEKKQITDRYVVLCLDESPSMAQMAEKARQKLETFFSDKKMKEEGVNYWSLTVSFDGNMVTAEEKFRLKNKENTEIPAKENPKEGTLNDTLKIGDEKLKKETDSHADRAGALILVTDGILDPEENEEELRKTLEKAKDRFFGVGFEPNNDLLKLADWYTDDPVVPVETLEDIETQLENVWNRMHGSETKTEVVEDHRLG